MSSGFRKEGDMPRLDTLKGFLEERLRQAEARAQDHDMQMEELVEEFNETESPSPKERHRFELERGLLDYCAAYCSGEMYGLQFALDHVVGQIHLREASPAYKVIELASQLEKAKGALAESQEGERT
jgi:hypothetical protein